MGINDWSTDESQNLDLDGSDISRRASPGAPANELTRKLMAHVKELEGKIVSDGIEVDGVSIVNNDGTLTVVDVAIDGDTEDLLTAKIEEIEAAATQAGEDATAAQTAATQAAASAASAASAITSAATAANLAAEQADSAARAAARAQSGAAMAESAVQAVMAGTNLNWQKSEKAGAVAVYPVPETALEPTVDFLFAETGPASGDKGPSNPSTISDVSSVNVGRIGKNLLLQATGTPSNYTIVRNDDGSLSISGSGAALFAVTDSGNGTTGPFSSYRLNLNKQYTLSVEVVSGSFTNSQVNLAQSSAAQKVLVIPSSGKESLSFTPATSNFVDGRFVCRFLTNASSVATNAVLKIQLEEGDTATDFEAPMLPADANHDTPLGSTYYGGTLDVASGVMTVTWWGEYVTSITNTELASTYVRTTLAVSYGHMGSGSAPTYFRSNYDDNGTYVYPRHSAGTARISISLTYEMLGLDPSTATEQTAKTAFESFLAQHPCFVVYRLYTPQTVQLTPTQIYSLSQLDPYTPRLNTVYTDAQSVQVGYAKSPIRSEYELTQAIIATEGGE